MRSFIMLRFVSTGSSRICEFFVRAIHTGFRTRGSQFAAIGHDGRRDPVSMVDKLTTVPRSKLGERIGRLRDEDVVRFDRAILVFLGIAGD